MARIYGGFNIKRIQPLSCQHRWKRRWLLTKEGKKYDGGYCEKCQAISRAKEE